MDLLADIDRELSAVPGIDRLRQRIIDDLAVVSTSTSEIQHQGALNNLRGAGAELAVWRWAPDPVAFQRNVQLPDGSVRATVDIVAASGLWWIEVKATAPFSTVSSAWLALMDQVRRLNACAKCYLVGDRTPTVLVVFTVGCSPEVADALRAVGVRAVHPPFTAALQTPPLPLHLAPASGLGLQLPPPLCSRAAHLDLGTLLALVSSSVHLPPSHAGLSRWARPNTHWQASLAQEQTRPLLARLLPLLLRHSEWRVLARDVERLEQLLSIAGGHAEVYRWHQLRIHLHRCDTLYPTKPPVVSLDPVNSHEVRLRVDLSSWRLRRLERVLSEARLQRTHVELLVSVASSRSVLFTSNGSLLRRLPPRLQIEHVLHEPRWLCGLLEAEEPSPSSFDRLHSRSLALLDVSTSDLPSPSPLAHDNTSIG